MFIGFNFVSTSAVFYLMRGGGEVFTCEIRAKGILQKGEQFLLNDFKKKCCLNKYVYSYIKKLALAYMHICP